MKFIADEMLGRLAKWLRILGYDTLYFRRISDYELLRLAARDHRMILTRDTKFPQRSGSAPMALIENEHYLRQIVELGRKNLIELARESVFTMCLDCNVAVHKVLAKPSIRQKVPPYVYERHELFHQCPRCEKIFWGGSHYENTLSRLREAQRDMC